PAHCRPLPFLFESNGAVTYFTNGLDPSPRSRPHLQLSTPRDGGGVGRLIRAGSVSDGPSQAVADASGSDTPCGTPGQAVADASGSDERKIEVTQWVKT